MHVSRLTYLPNDCNVIALNDSSLNLINQYILKSFQSNVQGSFDVLEGMGHHQNDDFYRANGSYHCFKTCNTWVNAALKSANLKACIWTPFDFRLMQLYDKE